MKKGILARRWSEQKKELRDYKKRAKAQTQLPQVEPVPITIEEIEEYLLPDQGDMSAVAI